MKIVSVPCLEDNYAYLLIDEVTGDAAAVDPVEPNNVIEASQKHGAKIKFVITTHHHWDHAGGNNKIKQLISGIKVYGGSKDRVEGCTDAVEDGDEILLGDSVKIKALHTPCHTKGHICYFATDEKHGSDPAAFTGDTLFIANCGKFFEGTAQQMYESLHQKLAVLPPNTRVFCGHEYSVKSLCFALEIEPENEAIKEKLAWCKEQRGINKPTVPSTIREELEINPYLRVNVPGVQKVAGGQSPVEVLANVRKLKDNWRG